MGIMTIKEARQAYTAQLDVLRDRQRKLLKEREENERNLQYGKQDTAWNGGSGVVIDLSEEYRKRAQELQEKIGQVKEQIDEHIKLRDQVIDEKKLMDFNMEVYMAAKNMAVMNADKKHKEYESLWEEEEEKGENPDPLKMVGDTEINVELPDIGMEED